MALSSSLFAKESMFFIHWSNSSLWLARVSVSVEMDSV
ncbi:hypothetical protein D030_4221A, partial [Vibrio parahaemolyticus AQ3810]